MIDWLTIVVALVIITSLVGIFGFAAWKISMPDPLTPTIVTGKKDDASQLFDSVTDKKKKDKSNNEQAKKKRKEQKKLKREKNEESRHEHVKFKEPAEESDHEREESDQESSSPQPIAPSSTKARKRNKNKASGSTHIEGILINKDEKSPVTDEAPTIPHPILAVKKPKDEVELARQHSRDHAKSSQQSNKPAAPAPAPAPVKKTAATSTNTNQGAQKQTQQQQQRAQHEQPFTTVVNNRNKTVTPPAQQQKPVHASSSSSSSSSSATTTTTTPPPSTTAATTTTTTSIATVQQTAPVPAQHEQLPQRGPLRQQEVPTQINGLNNNASAIKKPTITAPVKIADIIKTLPTSQTIVTEMMLALDAAHLSSDELDIIMHKIANKQAVIKKDWTKLQHGQKVDPQAHIGQVVDESARAVEEDVKNNAMKRIQELNEERNNDKRRINDLIKEKNEKEAEIQVLHVQLNSIQHPQQQIQKYEVEYKRLAEENIQLKQRLTQQQHFQQQQQQQQQQQYVPLNLINNNGDASNIQLRVLSEQTKKLSVDNANLEKKLGAKDSLVKEAQKEKDDLIRSNKQLAQKIQEIQKQFQLNEEKLVKELNESRNLHMNQLNDFKGRIEQLESDNEKLRQEKIAHIETMQAFKFNSEEREKYEKEINQLKHMLAEEKEKLKKNLDEINTRYQSQENDLRQQIDQLKKTIEQRQNEETQINNELATKNAEIEKLKGDLAESKAANDAVQSQSNERARQERDQNKQILLELLDQDIRNQLKDDNQGFNEWLSSYRHLLTTSIESSKKALQEESATLKRENDQLHKNMREVESQLKAIEQTIQTKEELLLADLKCKDTNLASFMSENEQLTNELKRLRSEIDRLQTAHDAAATEARTLKAQLDEKNLIVANSPSATVDDGSLELLTHDSTRSTGIDTRIDELNELIRSSKEALENQDSIVQQLDKHLNELNRSGTGETSTSNVDEINLSSSSDQQQNPS